MRRYRVVVVVLVILGGLLYWLYDGMMRSYGPYGVVRRTACFSNLKLIGRAALAYAEDNDGRLMPSPRWMDLLEPGLNTPEVLRCPCLKGLGKSGPDVYGYAYNSLLAVRWIKDFESPERTFLAYESTSTSRNAADPIASYSGPYDPAKPETGRANVVFLDGHTERVGRK